MLDGILPVFKEKGMTSHDVVFKLRKILQMKKIGHSGTLDPDVDGVLLILLGNSTKVSDYAMDLGKSYRAEVCLGIRTTTEDISGDIVEKVKVGPITAEKIKEVCSKLTGKITQIPPIYSAVKVKGKKLYEYARSGDFDVERPRREVYIYSIKLDEDSIVTKENRVYFTIDVNCGKGVYIRTIATQIGELLSVPSCMSNLRRTSSGKITVEDCYTLEQIGQMTEEEISKIIQKKEYALESYQFYELPKYRAKQVMNGLRFRKNQFAELDFTKGIVFTYEGEAIAIYHLRDQNDKLLSVKTTFPKEIN